MNEENEKVQNQDEEILNPQETEEVEGGVKDFDLEKKPLENEGSGIGCDCGC